MEEKIDNSKAQLWFWGKLSNFLKNIYLAVPGVSCSMWDLQIFLKLCQIFSCGLSALSSGRLDVVD